MPFLVTCAWKEVNQPSVLVIAVESLGFNTVSCGQAGSPKLLKKGFHVFCQESVRFTHAYTPSVMSQASLASILTAKYPSEHGVWHNGNQFLSAKYKTIQELVVAKGVRTSFISGGAPIWRKSGLSQGFEFFEDNVAISLKNMYRSAKENFNIFLNWLDDDVNGNPFFSVIYLPDLQFPDVTTADDLGEIRNRSHESQMNELSESLFFLIQRLKQKKIWDDLNVIVVGLNGRGSRRHSQEVDSINLYSENTQVTMFIKPARKQRDMAIEWKIDANVNLVDLGATLFDIYGEKIPASKNKILEVTSLAGVLDKPEVNWSGSRLLLLESGWPQWRGIGGSRFAVRQGQYLFIYDEEVKIYNTLVDRFENSPISEGDILWKQIYPPIADFFSQMGFKKWESLPDSLLAKLKIGKRLWRRGKDLSFIKSNLKLLTSERPWDPQVWNWLASVAIETGDWSLLKTVGSERREEVWKYVADKNLDKNSSFRAKGCEKLFMVTGPVEPPSPQECDDHLLIALTSWIFEKESSLKKEKFEIFFRLYRLHLIDRESARINYINDLNWDVVVNTPGTLSLADLYLSLPRARNAKRLVLLRLQKIKHEF